MIIFDKLTDPKIAELLKQGAIGVMPTDTLYGIVASINHPKSIDRLYQLRQRSPDKPCIILASSRDQIEDTDNWGSIHWRITKKYWPGPISIVLPTTAKTPDHLKRNDLSPPYRTPDYPQLRVLLRRSGPIIAPSANPEGHPPATTIEQAKEYFSDKVDFYVDGGELSGKPSTLIGFKDDKTIIFRQGSALIDSEDLL